jgi:hypothetical protein
VDVELAGLFRRWSEAPALAPSGDPSPRERARGELVEACLKRDFLLMAQSLEPGPQEADGHGAAGGSRVGGERGAPSDRSRAVREKQAGLLAELARRYEEQLLLPGAEEACNAALRVLRALRAQDPVDPRYPERIRELERQRNDVREILVAEPGLELLPPQVGGGGLDAGASGAAPRAGESTSRALTLELRNVTGGSLRDLRFQVRVPGLPAGTLAAVIPRLAPGGTATLNARVPAANGPLGAHVREDLRTRVLVLVTATDEDGERTFWLQAPLLVPPPGTGPPAGTPAGAR